MTNVLVHRCRLYDCMPCAIHGIAVNPTSSDIAVSRSNGNIEIWCTLPNLLTKLVIPGSGSSVEALLWVGNRLISGGINSELTEYDLTSGIPKLFVDSFGGAVWCLACSPDQKRIAAGCEDGSVKLFNVTNDTVKYERAFDKQEARILSISWHSNGSNIVTGSVDIIRLWSVATGHAVQKISLERLSPKVETIVWSVFILSDFTVISGDSYGRVQFWNGKNGTLLNSHQVHRADVLCMCLGKNENCVYAAGVDPKVIEFVLVNSRSSPSWKVGRLFQKHSHDIRALGMIDGKVFSGGVDTTLRMKATDFNTSRDRNFQAHSFPLRNHVTLATKAKLLLLQYSNYLDVWKIAESDKPKTLESGKLIPIEKNPIKLIKINTPSSDSGVISCSCISPCGTWLAYSTCTTTRLYKITLSRDDLVARINRVRCSGMTSAHTIVFTPDSNHVIISSINHKLLLIKLEADSNGATLQESTTLRNTSTITHLFAVNSDSKLLAAASLDGQIDIFDVQKLRHICSLPKNEHIPTAISFVPKTNRLDIAYANMQHVTVNLQINSGGKPSCSRILGSDYLLRIRRHSAKRYHAVVTQIFHRISEETTTTYYLSTEGIYVIEKRGKDKKSRFCDDFANLLFGDMLDDNTLFIVERTIHDIYSQLPPTLYQKKFGM